MWQSTIHVGPDPAIAIPLPAVPVSVFACTPTKPTNYEVYYLK